MARSASWSTLLLLLALAGCRFESFPAPPPWPQTTRAESLPYRVALAPVRSDAGLEALHAGVEGRRGSTPDGQAVRVELLQALRSSGAFARVEARGGPTATDEVVAQAAWDERDDLVLELQVHDHHAAFLGHTGAYVPWLVTYVTFVWPAWWMPVEEYGVGLRVTARLRAVQEAAPILERVYEVRPRESACVLTPSDRSLVGLLDVSALWNMQASLDTGNWTEIERAVGPHAWRRLSERLVQDIEALVVRPLREGGPVEREEHLRRIRKRLAVVAGVSTYADPEVGGGARAAEDARTVASALVSRAGGGLVEKRDLVVLVDEQATRAAVLAEIAAVGSRASASDEVFVYLAGLGTALPAPGGSSPSLLLHDARADDLAGTALSLRALGAALDALPAERVVVILDGSFGGDARGSRTLARPGAPTSAADVVAALGLRPGRVVLLAAAPGQPARVLPGAGAGLFAEVLRAGLGGQADADEDGRVTLKELTHHASRAVSSRAALEGFQQEPLSLGPVDDLPFGWPR